MSANEVAILPDEARRVALIREALAQRLHQQGRRMPRIAPDADLIELGLVDSQALFEIIMEVERQSHWLFDADRIDLEADVTLRHLAAAFVSE